MYKERSRGNKTRYVWISSTARCPGHHSHLQVASSHIHVAWRCCEGPKRQYRGDKGDGYWTTRGYANSRIANSRTGRLADWTSRGLVNSRTGQLADAIGDFACLVFLLAASARPRVVQSASWQSASWRIHELSSYQGDTCPHVLRGVHPLGKFTTIQDEKSAAKFHYIKAVSGKVVAQSIAFRVVSIYWQGDDMVSRSP